MRSRGPSGVVNKLLWLPSFHWGKRFFLFASIVYVVTMAIWTATGTFAAAQGLPQIEPPPLVRLTGVLVSIEALSPARGLSSLTVKIGEDKYGLQIKKFEKLTGQSTTELRLLESLFPPFLRITGPQELLLSLQKAGVTEKPFSVEGRLYADAHLLFLTDVHVVDSSLDSH